MAIFSGSAPVKTGTVEIYAGNDIPAGYLLCDGAAVSRTTYAALFAAIGTKFGAGNGSTTFNLPNFKVSSYGATCPVVGNGMTLGFLANPGAKLSVTIGEGMNILKYTPTIGVNPGLQGINNDTAIGVDINEAKSGLIAKLNALTTINTIIKY